MATTPASESPDPWRDLRWQAGTDLRRGEIQVLAAWNRAMRMYLAAVRTAVMENGASPQPPEGWSPVGPIMAAAGELPNAGNAGRATWYLTYLLDTVVVPAALRVWDQQVAAELAKYEREDLDVDRARRAEEFYLRRSMATYTSQTLPHDVHEAILKVMRVNSGADVDELRRLVDVLLTSGRGGGLNIDARGRLVATQLTVQAYNAATNDAQGLAIEAEDAEEAAVVAAAKRKPQVPRLKVWLTVRDSAVREQHQEAHGQGVPYGSRFVVCGGQTAEFPGDPTLTKDCLMGCRCFVKPMTPKELSRRGGYLLGGEESLVAAAGDPVVVAMRNRVIGFRQDRAARRKANLETAKRLGIARSNWDLL